jgi:hypothetical protein
MVEAAGVEPVQHIETKHLAEFARAPDTLKPTDPLNHYTQLHPKLKYTGLASWVWLVAAPCISKAAY